MKQTKQVELGLEKREPKLFDIYHDEYKTTGTDSYWIVFEDNDGSIQAGRLGPFNTHLESLSQLKWMKFVGNYKKDNSLIDLWKSNPPVMMGNL